MYFNQCLIEPEFFYQGSQESSFYVLQLDRLEQDVSVSVVDSTTEICCFFPFFLSLTV
jgi:hypothetical protein